MPVTLTTIIRPSDVMTETMSEIFGYGNFTHCNI